MKFNATVDHGYYILAISPMDGIANDDLGHIPPSRGQFAKAYGLGIFISTLSGFDQVPVEIVFDDDEISGWPGLREECRVELDIWDNSSFALQHLNGWDDVDIGPPPHEGRYAVHCVRYIEEVDDELKERYSFEFRMLSAGLPCP